MANKTISIDLLIQTAKSVQSTEAQKSILLDIYEALKKVEKGSTAFDSLTEAANGLKESLGGVNASFEDIYGNLKPLSARLGEMEDRMYELALAGQQNTQEFKDLQAEAINMKRTIIDVDASVDAFSQKGAKLQGFIGALSGIAGGFAVIQGSMALLGVENEAVEQSLLKVQSALAILNGLQEINRLITEKNIVVQRILNIVMKANPIFIILGAITAVTAAWYLFTKATDKNAKSLEDQAKANDKVITNLDREIAVNKELGKSIDDLRQKRIDAYNDKIKIDTETLKEEQKKLAETAAAYLTTEMMIQQNPIQGYLYKYTFGASDQDVKDVSDKLDETAAAIADTQAKVILETKAGADEKLQIELNRLERERDLQVAAGKETIELDRKIIEQKKKFYKADSEEYKDLINERKVLDITYNNDLKERLAERRKLWADAINDISTFNLEQGFIIKEETLQAYSDSVNKLVELRKFQGEEAKRAIEDESKEVLKALREELIELKKLGKLKVNETKAVQAQIDLLENNKQTRLKNNTEKTEKEITDIIIEEDKRRRALLKEYTGEVLSNQEYNRYVSVTEKAFQDMATKYGYFLSKIAKNNDDFKKDTKDLFNTEEQIKITEEQIAAQERLLQSKERDVEYQKQINKELVESGIITQEDVDRAIANTEMMNQTSKETIEQLRQNLKQLRGTQERFRAFEDNTDLKKSLDAVKKNTTEITQDIMDSVNLVVKNSIGESAEAMDLITMIYNKKGATIIEQTDLINKELAKITGKELDDLKKKFDLPADVTTIKFSVEPKEGEIGLDQLVQTSETLFKQLGESLRDEYKELGDSETAAFEKILFKRYSQYKEDISQVGLTEEEKSTIRKEYIKDTEKIQESHNDKMILIDLAYGKISQADLVEYFKKKNATQEAENQKEIDVRKKLNEQLLTLEKELQDATMSLFNNMIDQKLAANDKLYQDTIDKIDAEEEAFNEQFVNRTALEQAKYDAELAFQAKRDNAERKRQLEEDKLNKKRFNAQKINDSTTAAINTTVAVTKTIAELGGVGALTPPGIALIAAIVTGGLIQQASILGQKYIPTYAKGGLVKGAGTGTSDSIDAKLSNGEVVINAKSVKAFAPLLDAINQAGGGVAIPYTNKPIVKSVESSTEYNFERLEGAILSLNDRPIETYVNEGTITSAQMRARKLNDRTSF